MSETYTQEELLNLSDKLEFQNSENQKRICPKCQSITNEEICNCDNED